MSTDESDSEVVDLPSAAECEERCQRFAAVTGTDTALAMFFLQDRQWDLDRSLNDYFEQSGGGSQDVTVAKTTEASSGNKTPGATSLPQQTVPQSAAPESQQPKDPKPHRVRVMSWNIDGLESAHLKQRTQAVINTIKAEKAEVVFLQEVVGASEAMIRESLKEYRLVVGGTARQEGYYTAILLHKLFTVTDDFNIVPFYSSVMCRNLLVVNAVVKGVPMTLMTSHLESTKSHAGERKRQLQIALKQMGECPSDRTVVFAGDMNLRDKELSEVGGLPTGICDMWEATGCRKEARYTWDTFRNDNLGTDTKWRTKLRFDRMFLRHRSSSAALKPVYFELVGLSRLEGVRCFPSDHWGILTHFDIDPSLLSVQ